MPSNNSTPTISRLASPHSQAHNTTHPAYKLLSRAHADPSTVDSIFLDKIAHKPLLLSTVPSTVSRLSTSTSAPIAPSASAAHPQSRKSLQSHSSTNPDLNSRAKRRHIRLLKKSYARKHARPKPLSAKERRELGLFELRAEDCRYEVWKGVNRLWRGYILEVLGLVRDGRVVMLESESGVANRKEDVKASDKGQDEVRGKGKGDRRDGGKGQGQWQGVNVQSAGALIASADFHGMDVEIVRCNDTGRIGLSGIVIRETRSAMWIISDEVETEKQFDRMKHKSEKRMQKGWRTNDGLAKQNADVQDGKARNKVRMVLKRGTVFRVTIDLPRSEGGDENTKRQLVFELIGDNLEVRPIERAVKKFKWRTMDYL